ncbi:MAG: hypothetical protein JXA42_10145 [Anaerolineales bacterium]|nr:hypothetical protein [Anaerolineales bacterium]
MNQTPLFQLNLMLWLTWPAPSIGTLRPIFLEDGFSLRAIGPAFEMPLEVRAIAGSAGIPFQGRVGPDVLLDHKRRKIFLPIECKVSSFGPDKPAENKNHPVNQANTLLTATGFYLADYLGLPAPATWRSFLLYSVSGGQEAAMYFTLEKLIERMRVVTLDSTSASAIGIYINNDGIYLKPALSTNIPITGFQGSAPDGVRVLEIKEGQDPRLLYLLPWDPSIGPGDEYEQRILEERVRSALTSLIGSRMDLPAFTVSLDEILQTAVEVWDTWQDRQATAGFRNAVRAYVKQILSHLRKMDVEIQIHQDTFSFLNITIEISHQVRRYLAGSAFRRGEIDLWSKAVQLDFSSLADGW